MLPLPWVGDAVGVEHEGDVGGSGRGLAGLDPRDRARRDAELDGDVFDPEPGGLPETAQPGAEPAPADRRPDQGGGAAGTARESGPGSMAVASGRVPGRHRAAAGRRTRTMIAAAAAAVPAIGSAQGHQYDHVPSA